MPSTVTAGSSLVISLRDQDSAGTTNPAYSGTATFVSSDTQAVLPGDQPFTLGFATATATLKTSGTQTIDATDTVNTVPMGTLTLVVLPRALHQFVIITPSSVTGGDSIVLTVSATDIYNNVITGYAGTVHFTSTDTAAVLPTNHTLTAGMGTFTATLKTVGTKTITANDTVTASITGISNAITVVEGTLNHFVLTTNKGGNTVSQANPDFTTTVTAVNIYSNPVTFSDNVDFTSSPANGVNGPVIGADTMPVTNMVVSPQDLACQAGNTIATYTITATYGLVTGTMTLHVIA